MHRSSVFVTRKTELRRERRLRRSVKAGATVAAFALLTGTGGILALSANAAPGDTAVATGQFLSGSLFDLPLGAIVDLAGVLAQSNGSASDVQRNPLSLTALSAISITLPGGIQVPLDIVDAGVIAEYAAAQIDGSSLGASGLVSNAGAIGVGPNSDDVPGDLTLSLSGVVGGLGLDAALLAELANLDLRVGAVSGMAQQTASGVVTGSYEIADLGLTFQSPTLAGLTGALNTQVAGVQTLVSGLKNSLTSSLTGLLNSLGLVEVSLNVGGPILATAVAGLTGGILSDAAYPGVSIDLGTGMVTVDLDKITMLNAQLPGTDVLTDAVINQITAQITGLVGVLTKRVQNALMSAINGISVTGSVALNLFPLPSVNILTLNTTAGKLLAGDIGGLTLLGLGLGIAGGLTAVLDVLTVPLNTLDTTVAGIGTAVLAPVTSLVVPAVKPVLNAALTLTVNNQSTTAGVFTETALRVTLLPTTAPLVANLGTGTVGPNAIAPPAPSISELVPDRGPETGGTSVTITGTDFAGSTGVTFDGLPGTAFTVVSNAQITVTSPAHAPEVVEVVVQSPAGPSASANFTYTPVTVIDSIDPAYGPEAGGTTVTITGHCFNGATGVTFDGVAATNVVVVSDTEITADSPAGVGQVDVVVLGVGECGTGTLDDAFSYISPNAPVITGLDPVEGPETGGTVVVITGTDFGTATAATFGGTPGTVFTVNSDTQITVTSPVHIPATVGVVVQSPDGGSAPMNFTFTPITRISTVDPGSGPEAGGTTVTITGVCFLEATAVHFGAVPATSFMAVSDTEITAVSPAGIETVSVTVTGGGTCGPGTIPDGFTYIPDPAPTISGLDPDNGPVLGGTVVTITGTGFIDATGATFDGDAGTTFVVESDTEITVSSPPHVDPETVDVVVLHPAGDSAPGDFTYTALTFVGNPGGGDPGGPGDDGPAEADESAPAGLAFTGTAPGLLGAMGLLTLAAGAALVLRRRYLHL